MYTLDDLNKDFPDDDSCMEAIIKLRYGSMRMKCPSCSKQTKFHKVRQKKVYVCQYCGYHLCPLANTLFHKSSTPLKKWFTAIFLMTATEGKLSARKLRQILDINYKTAMRMKKLIIPLTEK